MKTATGVNAKPKKRPAETGTLVGVRLQPDMLAAIDKFVDEEAGISRPEAIRLLLKQWLTRNKML